MSHDLDLSEFVTPGTRCPMQTVIEERLDPDQLKKATAAMALPWTGPGEHAPHSRVAQVINSWIGENAITPDQVGKHRRKVCSCG